MKLGRYLKPSRIILRMRARDKWDAIGELLDKLVADGVVQDPARAKDDVIAREKRMSTGMEEGLAVPHAKTEAVSDLVVAMGVAPEGIEFESLDGKPARVVFLVLSRVNTSGPHVECISEIAKACSDPLTRERLLKTVSVEEVLQLL